MKPSPAQSPRRRPPADKRRHNKERTKEGILRAALALFSRKGFERTTTKEISRKAGIAEGTLFNYFPTKEDLALYFLEQGLHGLIDWYEEQDSLRDAPVAEKLFALVHHHLELIAPYEDFIGAVYLRALRPSSKLSPLSWERRELNLRYLRFVGEILAAAEAKGELPRLGKLGPYAVCLFQVAMLTHWLHDRSPGKEETLALLDRGLKVATGVLRGKGGWDW